MSDMPEKIWAHWEGWLAPDSPQKEVDYCQAEQYIRADLAAKRGAAKDAEIERLRKACQNFVDKVESGRARSRESYAEMKLALTNHGQKHEWEMIGSPGVWENYYECMKCHTTAIIPTDSRDGLPIDGCINYEQENNDE